MPGPGPGCWTGSRSSGTSAGMDEAATSVDLPYAAMVMGLGGGLALFLHGMHLMTEALKLAAGDGMKRLLEKATRNRMSAAGAGALVTAIVQSSSVVTVLLVGFISAGLLSVPRAVGVIIGANVGTTITAQIIAFKVTAYALALIGGGFLIQVLARRQRLKHVGTSLLGLGLIFFGMTLMSDAMQPLRDYRPFLDLMAELRNPFAGVAVGALFTALVQSSSVTTGVVIVLAGQGLINLEAGIALIFGANVGTCVTAMLAALGRPVEAVRIAVVHVIYNLLGVLLWLAFIPQFAALLRAFSPQGGELTGIERIAYEAPRQIANAHTLFNVANALLFIWLTVPLAWLATRLVPARPARGEAEGRPRFLDPYFLQQPAAAFDRVRDESARMGGMSLAMVREAFAAATVGTENDLDGLVRRDHAVDALHAAIVDYLGRLSQQSLVESHTRRLHAYLSAANYLENVGDVVETTIVDLGRRRATTGLRFSQESLDRMAALHEFVCLAGEQALRALAHDDVDAARSLATDKAHGKALADRAREQIGRRLADEHVKRLDIFRWESDLIDSLDRLHTIYRRIGALVIAHRDG